MVTYPADWTITSIASCADILQGGTPRTTNPTYWNGDIVWVTPGEITKLPGLYVETSERKITEAGLANSSATLLPPGTILLCTRATIGDLAIADVALSTNQGFKNLVCKPHVNNVFFAYLLTTMKEEMIKRAIGTTFLEISKKELSAINVYLPSIGEQKRIAKALQEIDTYISDLAALIEKKKAIREGAVTDLMTGKTRLTGYTAPWGSATLGTIGTFTKGAPLSKAAITETGTPFILYGELYTTYGEVTYVVHRHTKQSAPAECISRVGDVIIPTSGETAEEIATACCVMAPGVILAGDLNIYRAPDMDGRFISHVINHVINRKIAEVAQGISIIHINAKVLGKMAISYPQREEQSAIADVIDKMDTEIRSLEAEREKMIQIREGAMNDLLTGRVRLSL